MYLQHLETITIAKVQCFESRRAGSTVPSKSAPQPIWGEVRNAGARVLLADMTKLGIRGCTNATSFVAGVEVVPSSVMDSGGCAPIKKMVVVTEAVF